MLVLKLLTETLKNLCKDDFDTFKFYLSENVLEGCKPILLADLENATQVQTAKKMIDSYREESAVNLTVEILKEMNCNGPAETLKSRYAAIKSATAASSSSSSSSSAATPPAAPPAAIIAQHGAMIFAPNVNAGTTGAWNFNINNKQTPETQPDETT